MALCRENKKEQFLGRLTDTITEILKADKEPPPSPSAMLADIQKSIIRLCTAYNILESVDILHALPIQKDQLSALFIENYHFFPATAFILTAYLLNEENKANTLSKKERAACYGVFMSLMVGSIVSSSSGVGIPVGLLLFIAGLIYGASFKPILKYYKKHKMFQQLYSDLPECYKSVIDLDLARRDISLYPADQLQDALEKTTDYKKYQAKRIKAISKELSSYSVFAHKQSPRQIVLDYVIDEERTFAELRGG